jgi:hypothetical protein
MNLMKSGLKSYQLTVNRSNVVFGVQDKISPRSLRRRDRLERTGLNFS